MFSEKNLKGLESLVNTPLQAMQQGDTCSEGGCAEDGAAGCFEDCSIFEEFLRMKGISRDELVSFCVAKHLKDSHQTTSAGPQDSP